MVSEIRIYIEGGGDRSHTKRMLREGFGKFLEQLRSLAREQSIRWNIRACGPRNEAFDDFLTALRTHPEAFNVLLVDAEGPVREGDGPWAHLYNVENNWRDRSPQADDEQCHLMVQMMEAWLVADVEVLSSFYNQDFNNSAIPRNPNVEQIGKDMLASTLEAATRHTSKGKYHKIRHGAKLLGLINPETVRSRAPHCERLFTTLANKMGREI